MIKLRNLEIVEISYSYRDNNYAKIEKIVKTKKFLFFKSTIVRYKVIRKDGVDYYDTLDGIKYHYDHLTCQYYYKNFRNSTYQKYNVNFETNSIEKYAYLSIRLKDNNHITVAFEDDKDLDIILKKLDINNFIDL